MGQVAVVPVGQVDLLLAAGFGLFVFPAKAIRSESIANCGSLAIKI
jgi:hypothetical protein